MNLGRIVAASLKCAFLLEAERTFTGSFHFRYVDKKQAVLLTQKSLTVPRQYKKTMSEQNKKKQGYFSTKKPAWFTNTFPPIIMVQ